MLKGRFPPLSRSDRSGVSLVEVSVGVALAGGVLLALMQMNRGVDLSQKTIQAATDMNGLASQVGMVLWNPALCNAFVGAQLTDGSPLSLTLPTRVDPQTGIAAPGGLLISASAPASGPVKFTSVKLVAGVPLVTASWSGFGQRTPVSLVVAISPGGQGTQAAMMGTSTLARTFDFVAYVSPTSHRITQCGDLADLQADCLALGGKLTLNGAPILNMPASPTAGIPGCQLPGCASPQVMTGLFTGPNPPGRCWGYPNGSSDCAALMGPGAYVGGFNVDGSVICRKLAGIGKTCGDYPGSNPPVKQYVSGLTPTGDLNCLPLNLDCILASPPYGACVPKIPHVQGTCPAGDSAGTQLPNVSRPAVGFGAACQPQACCEKTCTNTGDPAGPSQPWSIAPAAQPGTNAPPCATSPAAPGCPWSLGDTQRGVAITSGNSNCCPDPSHGNEQVSTQLYSCAQSGTTWSCTMTNTCGRQTCPTGICPPAPPPPPPCVDKPPQFGPIVGPHAPDCVTNGCTMTATTARFNFNVSFTPACSPSGAPDQVYCKLTGGGRTVGWEDCTNGLIAAASARGRTLAEMVQSLAGLGATSALADAGIAAVYKNLTPATYTFKARATSAAGLETTSDPLTFTVQASAPKLVCVFKGTADTAGSPAKGSISVASTADLPAGMSCAASTNLPDSCWTCNGYCSGNVETHQPLPPIITGDATVTGPNAQSGIATFNIRKSPLCQLGGPGAWIWWWDTVPTWDLGCPSAQATLRPQNGGGCIGSTSNIECGCWQ